MSIKVISLKSSKKRSLFLNNNLELLFSFFDAIEPSDIKGMFNDTVSRIYYGINPREVEKACAISHRLLINECIYSGEEWNVILEDDAIVEEDLNKFNEELNNIKTEATILILGHSKTVKKNLWWQNLKQPKFNCHYYVSKKFFIKPLINYYGCIAYCINQDAVKIIKSLPDTFWIADDWRVYEKVGVKILHADIPFVWEDRNLGSSTGGHDRTMHELFSKYFYLELYDFLFINLKILKYKILGIL